MYKTIDHNNNMYSIEDEMVRAFFFVGTENALLVDTCASNEDISEACRGITDKPIILLNTHADDDHTGGNCFFEKTYMHPAEYAWYYKTSRSLAENTPPEAVWDGNIIDIGGMAFEVIHIPGHTPGSIALFDKGNRILVAGDSVSATPVFMFSSIRNIRAYAESMKKLMTLEKDIDVIYASHGPIELKPNQIQKQYDAAKKLISGELEGKTPPFELPALMYEYDGAAFFF